MAAFSVMFGYLAFFRLASKFGLPDPPGPLNMIQMVLTLKVSAVRGLHLINCCHSVKSNLLQIAGVGFEKTASWKKLKEKESKKSDEVEISEYDVDIQSIGIVEIFHYSFNYIGILTGKKGGKIVDTVSIKLKLRQTDMHVRRQS